MSSMTSQTASIDPRDLDLETHLTDDHHQAVKLWLRLLSCTNKIESAIRRRLRERFDTSLARFDLMAQLERCPEGLKMNELSQRMMVTGSNVTGLTDHLESKGLVVRETAAEDRRTFLVRLTADGRRLFSAMAREHESWVIELLGGLNTLEKDRIHRLLASLKEHVTVVERTPRTRVKR
jgi:DNA-binding MarR family transcriptional regulator